MKQTHWKKLFNYDYLGSYAFNPGEIKVLTIKSLEKEMVTGTGGKKDQCLVCKFSENEKPMILNRTNCKAITKAYGTPITENWIGKRVSIFVQDGIKVGGEITDGLRIKDVAPGAGATLEDILKEFEGKILTDPERKKVQGVIDAQDQSKYEAVLNFLKSKI